MCLIIIALLASCTTYKDYKFPDPLNNAIVLDKSGIQTTLYPLTKYFNVNYSYSYISNVDQDSLDLKVELNHTDVKFSDFKIWFIDKSGLILERKTIFLIEEGIIRNGNIFEKELTIPNGSVAIWFDPGFFEVDPRIH